MPNILHKQIKQAEELEEILEKPEIFCEYCKDKFRTKTIDVLFGVSSLKDLMYILILMNFNTYVYINTTL